MAVPSFIFGGDTGLSYEQLQKRRAVLEAMQARSSGQVARNVPEGLVQLGEALGRRLQGASLDREEAAMQKEQAGWDATLGSAQEAMFAPAVGPGAGFSTATGPIAAGPTTGGNDIYNNFIDTAKTGIQNPYGLAALAATGQAESGYDPKNAYGSWADPSQSGQAGTAGGILSWRAERLAGLQKFAAANGDDPSRPSPATQAKYFLQEDPNLVATLNGAKSVEEAQSAINNAWKFAGYDQPGGETARRLGLAQGYLSKFQGGGQQVASLDPSTGMGAPASGDMPWLRYANQGATRSQPLAGNLTNALGFLPELGVTAEVFSGGQSSAEEGGPRTGSTRHDHGGAADMRFYRDGRQLDWADPNDRPVFEEIVRRGRAAGLTGFGAGDGYMGRGTMHVGFGTPGVWGAGGKSANAPDWLRNAFEGGAAPAQAPSGAPVQVASLDPSEGMAMAYAPAQRPASASDAIVAAIADRQAANQVPALPAPQEVAANPLPPQDELAGLDPRTSPEARALMVSGQFDGVSYSSPAVQKVAQALPLPSVPAAPTSPGVATVTQAVQQAAEARGVDPRVLIGIASNPRATDQQRRVAQAILSQQMEQQQAAQQRAYETQQKQQEYARQDSRFAVTDARDDARLELERQRFARESGKPIEVGGVLLDPNTMQPVYTAPEKPTADIQEFEFARRNGYKGDFVQFQLDQKKAGAASTTINNGGDSGKFYEEADKNRGKAFAEAATAGDAAQRSMIQIGELEKRLSAVGTGGMASVKQMAANLGIPVEGADDIQAATAIINQLVPGQRPPGSGTMSDADVELFKQSLPRIINSEGGNAKILATMRGIAQYDAQRGAIANQVLNREITPAEGQKLMNAIPNPLAGLADSVPAPAAAAPASIPKALAPGNYRWNPQTNSMEPM